MPSPWQKRFDPLGYAGESPYQPAQADSTGKQQRQEEQEAEVEPKPQVQYTADPDTGKVGNDPETHAPAQDCVQRLGVADDATGQ